MCASEVIGELARRQSEQVPVAMAVQCDLVPGGCDLGGERAPLLDLLADQEERCRDGSLVEHVEDRHGALGMRAIVECQNDM